MNIPEPSFAALTAIRHWSNKSDLSQFATERHGFGDSDCGFGITYPGDLDDRDHREGRQIPEGFVQAYGFGGPPDGYEVLVPEWLYCDVLAEVLECLGMPREAVSIRLQQGWLGSK